MTGRFLDRGLLNEGQDNPNALPLWTSRCHFIGIVPRVVTRQRFAARVEARQTLRAPGPFRIELFLSVTPRWDLGQFPASQFVLD